MTPGVRRNSNGFTLVEIMVGLAISAVIMVGTLTLLQVTRTQLRNSSSKFNAIGIAQEVRNTLVAVPACTQALRGQTLDPDPSKVSSVAVAQSSSGAVIKAGSIRKQEQLYVQNLYFTGASPAGTSVAGKPLLNANLYLTTSVYDGKVPTDPGYGGVSFAPVLIGNYWIEVESDKAPSKIRGCVLAANMDVICAGLGGIPKPDGTCGIPTDYADVCAKFGGTWTGLKCNLGGAGGGGDPGAVCSNAKFAPYFDYAAYFTCTTTMVNCHRAADSSGTTAQGESFIYVTDPNVAPVSACTQQCISGAWTAASCQVVEAVAN